MARTVRPRPPRSGNYLFTAVHWAGLVYLVATKPRTKNDNYQKWFAPVRVVLGFGSALPLAENREACTFSKCCFSSCWARLRNTSEIQNELLLGSGSFQKRPESHQETNPRTRNGFSSRRCPYFTRRTQHDEQTHFGNVCASRVPGTFWPNKDVDPTLSTTQAGDNHL